MKTKPTQKTKRFTHRAGDFYGTRWLVHDPEEHLAGVFTTQAEARAAARIWSKSSGDLVRIRWKAPQEDTDGFDRGTYTVTLTERRFACKTGDMEYAAEVAARLRNAIAKYGFGVVDDVLFSAQTALTFKGWCQPPTEIQATEWYGE